MSHNTASKPPRFIFQQPTLGRSPSPHHGEPEKRKPDLTRMARGFIIDTAEFDASRSPRDDNNPLILSPSLHAVRQGAVHTCVPEKGAVLLEPAAIQAAAAELVHPRLASPNIQQNSLPPTSNHSIPSHVHPGTTGCAQPKSIFHLERRPLPGIASFFPKPKNKTPVLAGRYHNNPTKQIDTAHFDAVIYAQLDASSPPPDIPLPAPPEQQTDEPHYFHINPCTQGPQSHSASRYAAKAAKIRERGWRKGNFGQAAQSLRRQQRNGGVENWEGRLPDKILKNPAWISVLRRLRGGLAAINVVGDSGGGKAHAAGGGFTPVNRQVAKEPGVDKKGPRKPLPSTRNAARPSIPRKASSQEAEPLLEINKTVLCLRDNGVVLTDPPLMGGVPLGKITPDHHAGNTGSGTEPRSSSKKTAVPRPLKRKHRHSTPGPPEAKTITIKVINAGDAPGNEAAPPHKKARIVLKRAGLQNDTPKNDDTGLGYTSTDSTTGDNLETPGPPKAKTIMIKIIKAKGAPGSSATGASGAS